MASKWANLDTVATDNNFACAWASGNESHNDATGVGSANAWAALGTDSDHNAAKWAALDAESGDDTDDVTEQGALVVAESALVTTGQDTVNAIDSIQPTTTLARIKEIVQSITGELEVAKEQTEIGNCVMLFEKMLSKVAEHGKDEVFESYADTDGVEQFVCEQLVSTDKKSRPLESHTTESTRLGIKTWKCYQKRAIMAVGSVVLQRACANAFLQLLCNRSEAVGGECLTFFEKHRGDETPFTRASAHDELNPDILQSNLTDKHAENDDEFLFALPEQSLQVIPQEQVSMRADHVNANLKVYQVDLEVAALYLLPGTELLVSFQLASPLIRLDRCTAKVYAEIHRAQANVLPVRSRFTKTQRIHTADGDKAQAKAERILWHTLKADPTYPIATYRGRCQVHRVYHCITLGLALFSSFITGQIRLALSLRGPGYFHKFKEVVFQYLVDHNSYKREAVRIGPGEAADKHRNAIWDIFFPSVRGRHQRRNRLKYWTPPFRMYCWMSWTHNHPSLPTPRTYQGKSLLTAFRF